MSCNSNVTPKRAWWFALMICCVAITSAVLAATTQYKYDSLGRLREAVHNNGIVTTYDLDAAGNRTQVTETLNAAAPASITVPATSITGNYTVTWTAGGSVTSYELWESTTSNFAAPTRVYTGAGVSHSLIGHGNGSFYYRVRGCVGSACTAYRTGGNATVVTLPPGIPSHITYPSTSTNGSFTITWGTASNTYTRFEVWEATNASFSGQTRVYNGAGNSHPMSGRTNGTWYYRVRACNVDACGDWRTGTNAVTDATPPNPPAWLSVPSNANGSYTINWAPVYTPVPVTHYHVQESGTPNFSTGIWEIHNGEGNSKLISNSTSGAFYYRVRACAGGACSQFTYGANGITNVVAPGAPATITVPATSTSQNIAISWTPSTGTVTRYEWFVADNPSFNNQIAKPHGTAYNVFDLGRASGTWYYRVRACNQDQCSVYTQGANPVVISSPVPDPPTNLSYSPNAMCSWAARWDAMPNATYYSFRDQSGDFTEGNLTTNSYTYSYCSKSGNSDDYKPKWVKACNANGCSGQTNFIP